MNRFTYRPSALAAMAAILISGPASDLAAQETDTGPRAIPARIIPTPEGLSKAGRALVAQPFWLPFWNEHPASADVWKAYEAGSVEQMEPVLADLRESLGVTIEQVEMGGVNAYILTPETIPAAHELQLIVNAHGGAYVFGSRASGTYEATLMAAYGGYRVLAFDYRLAPEAPYPAALDDGVAVWQAVLKHYEPERVAFTGNSASGGLIVAMTQRLVAEGLPVPAAVAVNTPWVDLAGSGDSLSVNEGVDNVLVSYDGFLSDAARLYAGDTALTDPGVSPVHGDFAGFPPTLLISGTRDLLLSDTVRTQRALRQAGVEANVQIFEAFSHGQYLFDPVAPETLEIFAEITCFLDAHLAP
ncbi:alpha/beta hydrolase [Loktanella sp. M215]|uniref:alpha/beta hydrolase n=1 Tax=Loktanella sp. M215 TaxID=2675431 RepID=UPI0023518BE2|nr:alpha/beta hydrolase [Loktanella sp. M215]